MGGRRSPPEPDLYTVLGVSPNAAPDEIKKGFKKKALEYHPDKNPHGEGLFKRVVEAYDILGSEESRRKYDLSRRQRFNSDPVSPAEPSSRSAFPGRSESFARRSSTGPPPFVRKPMNFDEMFKFDHEMAKKKGGFMKDFAAWRAGVEAEKEQEWKDLEERNLQREREEEAKRVREDQAKKKKLESIAKDVLQDWQEEMRRWEQKKAEDEDRAKELEARRKQEVAEARLRDLKEKENLVDDLLEKTRRQRQQARQENEREFIPTEAELEAKSEDDLRRLESILQSRLNFIRDIKGTRSQCVVCHDKPRQGPSYRCGHGPVTCHDCFPKLRGCIKCHTPLHAECISPRPSGR